MKLGRVVGTIVTTIQHPFFEGRKQLLVRYVEPDGSWTGDYTVAVDVVDAGVGQVVLVEDEGNGARQLLNAPNAPVRAVIVGIVDQVNTPGE